MFLYVEQYVKLTYQSCSGLKNVKIEKKNVKNLGKSCFAVWMAWVKSIEKWKRERPLPAALLCRR